MDRSICYQEECAPGGCFMELAVQMMFIFVGKQFLMQFVEYAIPLLRKGRHTSTRSIFCSFLPAWLLHSWFCATENYILNPKYDAPPPPVLGLGKMKLDKLGEGESGQQPVASQPQHVQEQTCKRCLT